MLDTILKALDILMNKLKDVHSSDHKRAALAKQLFHIYEDASTITARGRRILSFYERYLPSVSLEERGQVVLWLTEQLGALDRIQAGLRHDAVNSVIQLHIPDTTERFICALNFKEHVVWLALDHLVSDGEILSRDEWIARLEQRMADNGFASRVPTNRFMPWLAPGIVRNQSTYSATELLSNLRSIVPPLEIIFVASSEEVKRSYSILDALDTANESLRVFLIEKFKIEDLL